MTAQGDSASIPVNSIMRFARVTGSKRHALTGALIGAAVGVSLGIWVASETVSEAKSDVFLVEVDTTNEEKAKGALIGGLIFGVIGGFVGHLTVTDRWEPVPVSGLSIEVLPVGRDSFTLSAAMRF